ncbi:ATP-binding protein [Variovorax sp. JS1663]|uniref:ATP-binding protein n=1 Tax=Variovorax sp. JS1663 TaxID=1851577 RepID=UPI000B343006|nr:adenylate/guanylate cyclase domain-containing protein [Variovorax sp. JS1663]
MSDTHFDAGPSAPGRRYVALLFADLSHSTELAGAMEAEDYAALLAALRNVYQEAIPKHGGVVVRVQGDGLLAMFGYPHTREDDGRRAVDAALDLHQSVRELRLALPAGRSLSLHSGVHSGLVLIGAGDIERGRFELLGPVPHIAARLSEAAGPHEILVSEETLGPASRFFSTGPPRQLQMKGRDAPLLAHPVAARADDAVRAEARARHGMSPFVGRAAELDLLEQRLAEAMSGKPRSVAIAAAAGMGKTRLIEQFLRRAAARGCRILRGYCESDLGAVPLQPFRQMLQSTGAEAPPEAAEDFTRWIARLAETQPTVVFVDDWHWADDASKQVLAALRRLAGRRLLVMLSTRLAAHDEAIAAAAQTIPLAPLTPDEAAQAIAARLPGTDPFVAAEIARHAGGNPLFIEELCHSAALGGSGLRPGRLHGGAGWLDQLVESRVQRLPPAQIELVRVAAVIGNVVPAWLLSSITGHGEDSPAVRGLAEQDFVFPGEHAGTLRFKHGITRDIIYESVGLHARQQLHRRIAQAIQQQSAAAAQEEALACHFDAGGDAAQAAHYAELAGDKALAASALDRARAQYRAALAALDRLPPSAEGARRWVAIVQRLGLVCVYDPLRSELALSRRALHLAEQFGDAATVARARYWHAYISYSLGEARAAIAHGERALAEAEAAGEARLATQIVATLGETHATAAQYGPALELLDRAIAIKRSHRSGRHTNVGLAFSLVCRAYVLGDRGLFAQAHECFDEALACIGDVTHEIAATTHGWRSAVLLWQGRWREAREAARESGRIAEATRSLSQLSIARAIGAHADWMLERDPRAVQAIVEATAWLAPRESGLFRSLNYGWLAEGLIGVGRRDEGRHNAALALRRARERDLLGVAMTYRALARDAAARRPDAARRYIERAYATARARDSAHELAVTQLCEAEIALQQGQAPRAFALLDKAAAAFDAMFMAWHLREAVGLRDRASRRAG